MRVLSEQVGAQAEAIVEAFYAQLTGNTEVMKYLNTDLINQRLR